MAASIDQQFIEYIVKSVVGNPDAVSIKRTIDEKGVLLELTVDPEDLGRVIGKRGATAQSLRTLLRALGTKNDARYNLKIVDVGEPRPSRQYDDSAAAAKTDENPKDTEDNNDTTDKADSEEPAPMPDEEIVEEERTEEIIEDKPSDVVSRTRAELAELDDLDV
ncbi:MAG TPA: KH domain-containing protein [Candidatus Saccharimonadales bacterium]|nr:KH domain-containing protein [Candidatus Saccharimonadales bacterium]